MRTSIREERNRESIRTDHSSRACPPVHAEGKIDALGGGAGVHLSDVNRAGVLVAVVVLGGGDSGRGARFENAASVGRAHFFRGGVEYVCDVVAADAQHRRGQGVVESGPLLQHQSRRQNAAGRTVQRGAFCRLDWCCSSGPLSTTPCPRRCCASAATTSHTYSTPPRKK